jgi:hypothetical protein
VGDKDIPSHQPGGLQDCSNFIVYFATPDALSSGASAPYSSILGNAKRTQQEEAYAACGIARLTVSVGLDLAAAARLARARRNGFLILTSFIPID